MQLKATCCRVAAAIARHPTAFALCWRLAACALVIGLTLLWVPWGDQLVSISVNASHAGADLPSGAARSWSETVIRPGLRSILSRVEPGYILLAFFVHCVTTLLVAARWHLLLSALVTPLRLRTVLVWQLRAMAAGVAGLGQAGTEVARFAQSGTHARCYGGVGTVQVLERVVGSAALAVIVYGGLCFPGRTIVPQPAYVAACAVVVFALAALTVFFAVVVAQSQDRKGAMRRMSRLSAIPWIAHVRSALLAVGSDFDLIVKSVLYSLFIHGSVVFGHWLLAGALALEIELLAFMVAVPTLTLALALPITFAGLGVFEGGMILLLSSFTDVTTDQVLALCALHRLMAVPKHLLASAAFWIPESHRPVIAKTPAPASIAATLPERSCAISRHPASRAHGGQ